MIAVARRLEDRGQRRPAAHHPPSRSTSRCPTGSSWPSSGPSGSGKTTLLGLMAGLDAPTTGTHRDRRHRDHRARRGHAGDAARRPHRLRLPVLPPGAVADRARERPGADGAGRAARRPQPRAVALLDEVGLSDRGHHYPSQLSGGEQQRVAIARALANDPPLILADEPTGNLDGANGRHVLDLLLDVRRRRNVTLVLVTHDADIAAPGRRAAHPARRPAGARHDDRAGGSRGMRFVARHGRPRDAGVVAPAGVLLSLHLARRRLDRHAALGDPERAAGVRRRGAGAARRRPGRLDQPADGRRRGGAASTPASPRPAPR